MKLRLSKLIEFQIYYLLVIESFISLIGVPGITRYLLDVNLIFMVVLSLQKIPYMFKHREYNKLSGYIIFYMVAITAVAFIRLVPTGQIFWGIRNNFFFIFFFFICIDNLKISDVNRIMNNVVRLQIYNVFCGLVEFFIFDKKNDFLSGMFGTDQGANAYLNIYLVIICAYCFVRYIHKSIRITVLAAVIISSIAMAAISELKFFYFELAIILIVPILFSTKSSLFKRLFAVAVGILGLYIGFRIFAMVNNDSIDTMMSLEGIIDYNARSDFGENDVRIARFTAISQVNEYFFHNNLLNKLIGYGLGACESSETFRWCHSNFATRYETIGYRNISTSMLYLETGYIGLIMFLGIFVFIMALSIKYRKIKELNSYSMFTLIVSIMAIMNCVYNSSLRREISFLIFFSLSLLFIKIREYKAVNAKINNTPQAKKVAA